tara:strand:- start:906 stop:1442 length:537 start_codon:yes stop_codon:yes gene_type:complete
MKIITGKYKNLRIETINKTSTRPMMSRVRESLFSSINAQLINKKVLDLFAGSGSLGIESLSRGAASCLFVELSKESLDILIKNLSKTEEYVNIFKGDAYRWVQNNEESFDIVFLDPPFEHDDSMVTDLILKLVNTLNHEGLIILHRDNSSNIINIEEKLELIKKRKFGQSILHIYRKE